jgi:prophage antirepressor-like protein
VASTTFPQETAIVATDDSHGGNLSLSLTFPGTQQQIRVVGTLDRPEWVAKDVCDVLGIGNPSKALIDFDEGEKGSITIGNTPC